MADDPASPSAREALLGDANALAANLNSTSSQLQGLNSDVNNRITADVQQINSIGSQISNLNTQITQSNGLGQTPNQLLDQRDQLVSNLSQLVGVTTTSNSDGSINVYLGNGQPLVLDQNTYNLSTVPNQFNASQLEIASTASNGNSISSSITSGDLGGLLAARTQAIDPAISQLGQIATAVAQSANTQQASGLDLNGQLGGALFSVGAPVATASNVNTDGTTASVTLTGLGALSSDNYLLSYTGGAYSLTDKPPAPTCPSPAPAPLRAPSRRARRAVNRAVGNAGRGRSVSDPADGAGRLDRSPSRSPILPASRRQARSRRRPPTPTPEALRSAQARCSMPRTRICSPPRPSSS